MQILREYIRVLLLESNTSSKVIFMAGAPGSGKSTIINALGLHGDFEIINPDVEYENEKIKSNLPFDKTNLVDEYKLLKSAYEDAIEQGDKKSISEIEPEYLRIRKILSTDAKAFANARSLASARKKELMATGANYLVDGTGGNFNEINAQVRRLKSIGYDVAMIYNDIDLDSSIARDIFRGKSGGRRLGAKMVTRSHASVTKNKEKYESLFGQNFIYINSASSNIDEDIENAKNQLNIFMAK